MYREAYLVIAPKTWNFTKAAKDPEVARQLLWTAYIISLHGDNGYAKQIADRLSFADPENLSVLGGVFQVAREYEKSLRTYRLAEKLLHKNKRDTFLARAITCNIAQILSYLNRFDEAIAQISSLKVSDGDEYWKCTVLLYLVQFNALKGEFILARRMVDEVSTILAKDEGSHLNEQLFKYWGYIEGALGNEQKSSEYFSKAFALLFTPDSRPEFWLDSYYLEFRVGLASAEKQLALFSYPGLGEGFRGRPKFVNAVSVWTANSDLILFPDRDEWIENGSPKIRMTRELRLLAWLRASGDFGIPVERLKAMLWPDEMTSFIQLNARISQLLSRLKREFGVTTKVDLGKVRITESKVRVSVEILRQASLPTFFEGHPDFEAGSFAKYYGLGLTAARRLLDQDVILGRLGYQKVGKKYVYSVRR